MSDNSDFLAKMARDAEQQETAVVELAKRLRLFYVTLIGDGMPDDVAALLTNSWLTGMMAQAAPPPNQHLNISFGNDDEDDEYAGNI